jgi:branched-chain amino acid transport system permease protein
MAVDIVQLIFNGITMGCIYALVALGFHLIYNATGAINFAQGEQVMLGGVLAVTLMVTLKIPLPFVFLLTIIFAGLVGIIYGRIAIHPVLHISELMIIMGSIAASIILRNGIFIIWGDEEFPFPPFSQRPPLEILGISIFPQSLWIIGVTLLTVFLLWVFFRFTLMGKAIQACANNHTGARLVGISPSRVVAYIFAFGGILGAIAGVIMSPITFAGGPLGTVFAVKGFTATILGGISSSMAVVFGGILLGLLEFFIASYISSGYRDVIALTILIIILTLKPEGLFILKRS